MDGMAVAKPSVLVIEDDADLCDCVREELEQAGYHVVTAGNGREGLAQLDANPAPRLILLDLMMPIMNGYEFLAALRSRDHAPVVLTSAFLENAVIPERVSEILPKPFKTDALLALVARYC